MHQMSYSLNSFRGGFIGIIYETTIGLTKGDTRSLDYSFDSLWFGCRPSKLTGRIPPAAQAVHLLGDLATT